MKKYWVIAALIVALGGGFFALLSSSNKEVQVEYKYDPVVKGVLSRSTSASGLLTALTQVDIKSKAGGVVTQLFVREGDVVKPADAIALIDPTDTQDAFDQAKADLTTAQTKVDGARVSYDLQVRNAVTSVQNAQEQVRLSEINLAKSREDNKAQPSLTNADIQTAQAGLESARETLHQLNQVSIPQRRKEITANVEKARADVDAAKSDIDRQTMLLEKGYVAQSAVEKSRSAFETAKASLVSILQNQLTLEQQLTSEQKVAQAKVRQASAALAQARANGKSVPIAEENLRQAQATLAQSKISLQIARDAKLTVNSRRIDIQAAQAGVVRSRVSLKNTKVQLDSTKVVAPRAGVVTTKYLEEGTIIPPGTSTFSQGTSIVQLSDVTRVFVNVPVDETDISSVRAHQDVNIILEAYPRQDFAGVVQRIFPAATTSNSVTTVMVQVELLGLDGIDSKKFPLRPGMNATCEFIQFKDNDVLIVPQQAIKHDGQGKDAPAYVMVQTKDLKKPEKRFVKIGKSGTQGAQILEGLKEGELVVSAELDLQAMRDRQARIQQQQQGGSFGSQARGGPSQSLRGGATNGAAGAATGGKAGGGK